MTNCRLSLLATLMVASCSFAVAAEDRVDQRQQNQRARIAEGVATGELTAPEAHRMVHGQRHVKKMERRAEADGVVTEQESARLEQAQDVQSARIKRQKHDRQDR